MRRGWARRLTPSRRSWLSRRSSQGWPRAASA
jgi:hypothetical protein